MKKTTRFWVGLLFVLSIGLIGLMLGMRIGAACCMPENPGLAGGAIALGYGLMGAVACMLLALPAALYLPARWLVGCTLLLGVIGGVIAGLILQSLMASRAATAEHLRQAYERMNRFTVTLGYTDAAAVQPYAQATFDWDKREYRVSQNRQTCTVPLTGEQGAMMLKALRAVDGVMHKDPYPCAGTLGAVTRKLEMSIPEATSPPTNARLAITIACLQRYPALGEPFTAAEEILASNSRPRSCD